MKKALAMALGALLVVGSAAPASAASQVDFSGIYRTYFLSNWNQRFAPSEVRTNDAAYFSNRVQLNFGFHATDEVSVYWRLRAPANERWGDRANGAPRGDNLRVMYAFGEITQDWGLVSIGRLKAGYQNYGLSSLGWEPGGSDDMFTNTAVFGFDDEMNGIRYANRWDNGFQFVAQFLRPNEQEKVSTNDAPNWERLGSEAVTHDLYVMEPSYHWDGGGAALSLIYQRNHTFFDNDLDDFEPALKAFYISPAIAHSWGDFGVHFAAKFGWGSQSDPFDGESDKARGQAAYLDFDYNYGPGNVNLAGWWTSGTKADANKWNGLVGMNDGFAPLIVAYNDWTNNRNFGATNLLNNANVRSGAAQNDDGEGIDGQANHWGTMLSGGHAFTDDVTLKYAVAYLALNKVREGASKSIGWETDLGLQIDLLDNLHFRSTFGYLFAGSALKIGDEKAADAYNWFNTLTFSF